MKQTKDGIILRDTYRSKITLTKSEVDALKEYCDDNLEVGHVILDQINSSGIGPTTKVWVADLPETLTDITDINSW